MPHRGEARRGRGEAQRKARGAARRARELGEARHERAAHLLLHGCKRRLSGERYALRNGLR